MCAHRGSCFDPVPCFNTPPSLVPMFAVVSAAAATSHSPAFLWSGRPSAGLVGGDYLHELSGAELQNTVAGLVSGTVTQPLVTKAAAKPEVLAVFLHDELATEDVRTHGTDAFPVLQKLMADSPSSVSVPFTTRSASLRCLVHRLSGTPRPPSAARSALRLPAAPCSSLPGSPGASLPCPAAPAPSSHPAMRRMLTRCDAVPASRARRAWPRTRRSGTWSSTPRWRPTARPTCFSSPCLPAGSLGSVAPRSSSTTPW